MNQVTKHSDQYTLAIAQAHDLRRSKRYAEAALAFREAEAHEPGDKDALLLHAVALKEAGQNALADSAYRELLEQHPSFALGWSLHGVFLRNSGNYIDAIQAFRRSLELQDDIATRNALVVSLYKANLFDEAQAEGLRSLQQKDEKSLKSFTHSPEQGLGTDLAIRPFDPNARHRNIISFSLWGNDPVYVQGAIVNARIAPHIYYGWTTRFYCDASVPADAVEELRRTGAQIAMVRDPALQSLRPMWRFLVANDPNIDRFVCRDADSRLNCQELIAVEEWLRSGKPFHVMRDHLYHMDLILAGMWGGVAGLLPNLYSKLIHSKEYFNNRYADQIFLMYEVWPLIRDHLCTHDTYYKFYGGRNFPDAYRLPGPIHVGGAVKKIL